METEKSCIAIDVGGTKMLVAEVASEGTVLNVKRYPTGRINQLELVKRMIANVRDYEESFGWAYGKQPVLMGIGIVGNLDIENGIWNFIDHEFVEPTPLAAIMREEFDVTCYIDNDVKAATIAECVFGGAKDCRDMIYINVGTGLAAGTVSNGKVIRGVDNYAGEIGYMNFNMGKGPHLEGIASGIGLNRRRMELLAEYPDSTLSKKEIEVISGQTVFEQAKAGDALSQRMLEEAVQTVALLIENMSCVTAPEMVILGGGLIADGWLLIRILEKVRDKVKARIPKGIQLSSLNPNYTGLLGAAAIGLGYQKVF